MNGRPGAVLFLCLLIFAGPALAHVPAFPTANTAPDRAVTVHDPVKSWSFYDELSANQTNYYRLTLEGGQRLRVGTFTPVAGAFRPGIVVMSSALDRPGAPPHGVEVPADMGFVVIDGRRPPAPTYEPFAPAAYYHTATVSRSVDEEKTFLIAVYEPANRSGPVGVTVGYRESFTPMEYLLVPFSLVRTHLWAGLNPLLVLGPGAVMLISGVVSIRRRDREYASSVGTAGPLIAGLLIAGSGANTAVLQGVALARTGFQPGALLTLGYVLVPLAAGGWVVMWASRGESALTPKTRVGLALAGLAGLGTWAGFIVGPAAVLIAAAWPGEGGA
jgi:hypothetical protein